MPILHRQYQAEMEMLVVQSPKSLHHNAKTREAQTVLLQVTFFSNYV